MWSKGSAAASMPGEAAPILTWLSRIWNISWGEGTRPVSSFDQIGTSLNTTFQMVPPLRDGHLQGAQSGDLKSPGADELSLDGVPDEEEHHAAVHLEPTGE